MSTTTHTPASFAAILQGRQYGEEITREEAIVAKANGLVVVYGYSDDNCELLGAIFDGVGCYNGGQIHFLSSGQVFYKPDRDERDILEKYGVLEQVQNGCAAFTAVWGISEDEPAWTYKAEFPHATFDIIEDGSVFCRGIVFRLTDAFAGWQPIATAPRDGSSITTIVGGYDPIKADWMQWGEDGRFCFDAELLDNGTDLSKHYAGEEFEPTHWRPLPIEEHTEAQRMAQACRLVRHVGDLSKVTIIERDLMVMITNVLIRTAHWMAAQTGAPTPPLAVPEDFCPCDHDTENIELPIVLALIGKLVPLNSLEGIDTDSIIVLKREVVEEVKDALKWTQGELGKHTRPSPVDRALRKLNAGGSDV